MAIVHVQLLINGMLWTTDDCGLGLSTQVTTTHDKYTVSYSTIKESQPPSVFLSPQLPALVQ